LFGKPPKPNTKEESKDEISDDDIANEESLQTPKFKMNASLKEPR